MRVIHFLSDLDGGGVEKLLYDYCSSMKDEIYFDFVVNSTKEGMLEQPLRNLGFSVFRICQVRQSLIRNIKDIYIILKNKNYDIIQVHSGYKAIIPLFISYMLGINIRIAHSHQANVPEKIYTKILRKTITPFTKLFATHLFACGKDASIWMWGKRAEDLGKVYIMKNAVDTYKYRFSNKVRKFIREELKLEDKFIIGNVARMSYQKNHEFLISVFLEIRNKIDNAVLVLIGRGELEEEIKKKVFDLGLLDSIIFLGIRDDIPRLLNAIDLFLLPSWFEGLPLSLVEVQSNGLQSIVSDNITREIEITDIIKYMKLEKDLWMKEIVDIEEIDYEREIYSDIVKNNGYDIELASLKLIQKYKEILNR